MTYISVDSKDASRRTAVIRLLTYVNAAQKLSAEDHISGCGSIAPRRRRRLMRKPKAAGPSHTIGRLCGLDYLSFAPPLPRICLPRMQVPALFWNGRGPTSVVSTILSQSGLSFASMRYHFHIAEDGRFIEDDEGQEFSNETQVRDEAVEACISIAKDAFTRGSARSVEIDVRGENISVLKVVISLRIV